MLRVYSAIGRISRPVWLHFVNLMIFFPRKVVCWLCLLSLCLPLLLFLWFGHVIRWEDTSPVARPSGLDGYVRILAGSSVDQV